MRDRLTDPRNGSMRAAPTAVLGVLEGETVLLLGVSRSGLGMRSGNQPMMETVRYRARSLVVGVQKPQALLTAQLIEASVVFPGMLQWAGYESFDMRNETDGEGLVVSSVILIRNLPAGTKAALRARAEKGRRSVEAEARDVLTRALRDDPVTIVDLLGSDEGADIEFEPGRLGVTDRPAEL